MKIVKNILIACLMLSNCVAESFSAERAFFQKNHYLVVKDFFTEQEAEKILMYAEKWGKEAQAILSDPEADLYGSLLVTPESRKKTQVCRVEDLQNYEPGFAKLVETRVTHFISTVLGEEYVPFKDKLNFKWPGGGAFPPHQDFPAYEKLPPSYHVTAMLSVDHATEENGYLYFSGGWKECLANDPSVNQKELATGRLVLPYHVGGENHGNIEEAYFEQLEWKGMETSPRDLVFFDSFLPHYSKDNTSNRSRRAIFITYNKLAEGEHKEDYYALKRRDPRNPCFHFATPTE